FNIFSTGHIISATRTLQHYLNSICINVLRELKIDTNKFTAVVGKYFRLSVNKNIIQYIIGWIHPKWI
ncbi:MAG TPA: hypothetical protein VNJ50_05255, partial [Gelidibacter sp.]|uniref:hypothetical protein n=1 Tax=Gelidibacter sp. TaxID=2018083 RepID=UPI002C8855A9